ncbi:hypothetical protein GCM10027278_30790 [Paralcaligenes ginsengisoli]
MSSGLPIEPVCHAQIFLTNKVFSAAMDYLLHLIEQYGLTLVFFNVLIEQLGTPLPRPIPH